MVKPTIPSGTRDFSPEEVYKRQYIFTTIRSVFEKYGYQPIETPTMENLSTLEGKYGEEGDRLLFRILDSGNFAKELIENAKGTRHSFQFDFKSSDAETQKYLDEEWNKFLNEVYNERMITPYITGKGLRYDLTVPFARYVVMHQNEITFPFKRYQIQSVFRADRPQKGRYREFFQCDADVVGSDSLINEVELIQIYDEVFSKLGIDVTIRINSRKILTGITEVLNIKERSQEFLTILDKTDKIGIDAVKKELQVKGFPEFDFSRLMFFSFPLRGIEGNYSAFKEQRKNLIEALGINNSSQAMNGFDEIENIYRNLIEAGGIKSQVLFTLSLARGLNYYTGAIIEVIPNNIKMGSVGGGGRYDDLTGVFGLKGVSGVGISFGADRIYDVMEEQKIFPESASKGTQVLFCYFNEASQKYCLPLVRQVRDEGVAAEIYPSPEKMKKQLKYANDKKIPFVIVVGDNEMQSGKLAFKDMETGDQKEVSINEIIQQLK